MAHNVNIIQHVHFSSYNTTFMVVFSADETFSININININNAIPEEETKQSVTVPWMDGKAAVPKG